MRMERKMADCRRFPSESNCSLTIIGEEDEVVEAAAQHAASVHGHEDSAEMREQIRGMLEPESAYSAGAREQEPLPG
jgi:predicted small metal-binding protein